MKTKTTLAALLLAAVMVTPSYGETCNSYFFCGANDVLANKVSRKSQCFKDTLIKLVNSHAIEIPKGVTTNQLAKVVARYVYNHPEYHDEPHTNYVRRAAKETWPWENRNVVIKKCPSVVVARP